MIRIKRYGGPFGKNVNSVQKKHEDIASKLYLSWLEGI